MKWHKITEAVGIITKQNQTVDVGPNEIKKQAAKFGFKVDKGGRPATLSKKVKGSKTNVLFNLGMAESIDWVKLRNAKAVMPYALDSPEQRAKGLMPDAGSPNIYTSINLRTKLPAGYDAREFSKKEVSDQAWQKYMDGAWLGLKKVKKDQIKQAAKLAQIPIQEVTAKDLSNESEIYVDMDGVLADFFGAWKKLVGKDWREIKDLDGALQRIRDKDDFWLNIPVTPNAMNLLNLVKQLKGKYNILSAPLPNDPNSEPHKRQWIENNLSRFPPSKVIITSNKSVHATQPDGTPNILIDDFGKNIAKWEAAGGVGFKHKDHKFERTVKNLKAYMNKPVEEAPEDEINKMKQTATAIQKAQSMMKPRYMSRIAAMVEEDFEAIRDAALKRYKKANGKIDLYTAYTMAIEDEFPEIPNPIVVFQYMTDPIPDHEDLVPQDAEDGSWADRADKEYQQKVKSSPKGGGFDGKIKGRWFAIRRDRDDYMDQGMEPEDALDKAAERHGVDPEELQRWIEAGNATPRKEMTEKAVSKKQQQFFGIVRAMQKGEMPKGGEAGDVAKDMKKSDVKKFASTKHKGLPKKKKSESYTRDQLPQIHKKHLEYIPHKIVSIKVESIVPVQKERIKENYTKQLKKIAGGKYAPIVVDNTNRIINGHHRYDVIKLLQMESISVAKLPYTLEFLIELTRRNFMKGAGAALAFSAVPSAVKAMSNTDGELIVKTSTGKEFDITNFPGSVKEKIEAFKEKIKKVYSQHKNVAVPDFKFYLNGKYIGQIKHIGNIYKETNEGELIPNPQRSVLVKKNDGYDHYKLATHMANIKKMSPEVVARDKQDIFVQFYGGEKEKNYMMKNLKRLGFGVQDADGYRDTHFDENSEDSYVLKIRENFADGKKKGRKGLSKRVGIPKSASVTQLRKIASNSTGERRRMAHWQANMKSGRKKKGK